MLLDSSDLDGFDKVNQILLFVYKQTLNCKSFIFLIFSFHFFQDFALTVTQFHLFVALFVSQRLLVVLL